MNGVKRSVRYWNWVSFKIIAMSFGFAFGYGILFGLLDGEGIDGMLRTAITYLVTFGMVMGAALQVSGAQCYIQQCLSMGSRRKDVFIGLQYANILIPVIHYVTAFLLQRVIESVYKADDWAMDTGKLTMLFFYVVITLVVEGIGSLIGMVVYRHGRAGMILFTVFVALIAGLASASAVWMKNGKGLLGGLVSMYTPVFLVVAGLIYAVFGVIQYRMLCKCEVKA